MNIFREINESVQRDSALFTFSLTLLPSRAGEPARFEQSAYGWISRGFIRGRAGFFRWKTNQSAGRSLFQRGLFLLNKKTGSVDIRQIPQYTQQYFRNVVPHLLRYAGYTVIANLSLITSTFRWRISRFFNIVVSCYAALILVKCGLTVLFGASLKKTPAIYSLINQISGAQNALSARQGAAIVPFQ